MKNLDLSELRKIAETATQGEWECEADNDGTISVNAGTARTQWDEQKNGLRIGHPATSYASRDKIFEREDLWDEEFDAVLNNAEHIAAFDPPTVLALLDRLEAAESARDRWKERWQETVEDADSLRAQLALGLDNDGPSHLGS